MNTNVHAYLATLTVTGIWCSAAVLLGCNTPAATRYRDPQGQGHTSSAPSTSSRALPSSPAPHGNLKSPNHD